MTFLAFQRGHGSTIFKRTFEITYVPIFRALMSPKIVDIVNFQCLFVERGFWSFFSKNVFLLFQTYLHYNYTICKMRIFVQSSEGNLNKNFVKLNFTNFFFKVEEILKKTGELKCSSYNSILGIRKIKRPEKNS